MMMTEDPGFISLIPTLVVFILAVLTRRPIESLVSGSLVGLVMLNGSQFISGFAETSIRVMTDPDVETLDMTRFGDGAQGRSLPHILCFATPVHPCTMESNPDWRFEADHRGESDPIRSIKSGIR